MIRYTYVKPIVLECVLITIVLFFLIAFLSSGLTSVYGFSVFSSDDRPLGLSYDEWAARFWNHWIAKTIQERFTPQSETPGQLNEGDCLLANSDNRNEPMIMLAETADVPRPPTQSCTISSDKGIIVPLWVGWCDTGNPTNRNFNEKQLTECSKRQNLGHIRYTVMLDNIPVAKLDVTRNLIPGSDNFDYKVNSVYNVTQFTSKEFTLKIPSNTHKSSQQVGTWRAVSDGWWVFLKPLPIGQHTIVYGINVDPTGPVTSPGTNPYKAEVRYKIQVVK